LPVEDLGMAATRQIISKADAPALAAAGAHRVYRQFLAVAEELSATALQLMMSPPSGPHLDPDDPAVGWISDAAPVVVDRVGAALLAGDASVLLDYLSVELSELRRAGISEVNLIGLIDAVAASLPDAPSLPDGFQPARRVLAEGREHLLRAGVRAVRSVPALRELSSSASDGVHLGAARPPGQAFSDLLLLGALACQAPAALLSVPQPGGTWSTLSYGLETKEGCNDGPLFASIAAVVGPVEIADLVTSLPRSRLVLPPHSMRWAYGMAMRPESGSVVGVVVVLDHWVRQVAKREQRAMGSLARQLGSQLSQWRRPVSATSPASTSLRAPAPAARNGGVSLEEPSTKGSPLVSGRHQLLRSQEVAEVFDVTERTVINWAAAGKLPSLRTIGGHLRFRREDVLQLLAPPETPPAS
jgi:excisionase family DNA binding protein